MKNKVIIELSVKDNLHCLTLDLLLLNFLYLKVVSLVNTPNTNLRENFAYQKFFVQKVVGGYIFPLKLKRQNRNYYSCLKYNRFELEYNLNITVISLFSVFPLMYPKASY